jgi:hypothetical protein
MLRLSPEERGKLTELTLRYYLAAGRLTIARDMSAEPGPIGAEGIARSRYNDPDEPLQQH